MPRGQELKFTNTPESTNSDNTILDSKEVKTESDRKVKLGLGLKKEISSMQIDIEKDIKCLNKLLGAATITSDGYRDTGEKGKVLWHKLSNE